MCDTKPAKAPDAIGQNLSKCNGDPMERLLNIEV
jgi:hypothetical protein